LVSFCRAGFFGGVVEVGGGFGRGVVVSGWLGVGVFRFFFSLNPFAGPRILAFKRRSNKAFPCLSPFSSRRRIYKVGTFFYLLGILGNFAFPSHRERVRSGFLLFLGTRRGHVVSSSPQRDDLFNFLSQETIETETCRRPPEFFPSPPHLIK